MHGPFSSLQIMFFHIQIKHCRIGRQGVNYVIGFFEFLYWILYFDAKVMAAWECGFLGQNCTRTSAADRIGVSLWHRSLVYLNKSLIDKICDMWAMFCFLSSAAVYPSILSPAFSKKEPYYPDWIFWDQVIVQLLPKISYKFSSG